MGDHGVVDIFWFSTDTKLWFQGLDILVNYQNIISRQFVWNSQRAVALDSHKPFIYALFIVSMLQWCRNVMGVIGLELMSLTIFHS